MEHETADRALPVYRPITHDARRCTHVDASGAAFTVADVHPTNLRCRKSPMEEARHIKCNRPDGHDGNEMKGKARRVLADARIDYTRKSKFSNSDARQQFSTRKTLY